MSSFPAALTFALALLPVLAADARATSLLEIDGVELHGTARLVISGAGTCNVLETDTSYEKIKANHGAPMDVWRLDFSVRNGSGRWLDHLIARFEIDSEWPDCTNWSGPEEAQLRSLNPAVRLEDMSIGWSGSTGFIQETGRNVVAPGQTLTDTELIIVLRGDPAPRFSNWSMDFEFGSGIPLAGATPSAVESQENLYWRSIMSSTNPAEFQAYLAQFPNGVFRALAEARLAELRSPTGDPPTSAERRLPMCTKDSDGNSCWMELTNQPGCYVWNPNPHPHEIVTWTAECAAGTAQGTGTLTWLHDGTVERATGRVVDGRFLDGRWVTYGPDGAVVGSTNYVNGVSGRRP